MIRENGKFSDVGFHICYTYEINSYINRRGTLGDEDQP